MSQARNAAKNVLWMWGLTPVRHVAQLLVAALTFRHFGAEKLGLLALVLSFTELVKLSSKGWLGKVLRRDVAQRPDDTAQLWSTYCVTVCALTLPPAVIGAAGAWWLLPALDVKLLAVIGLAWAVVNCFNLSIFFDSWHRSRYDAQALTVTRLVRCAMVVALIMVARVQEVYWLALSSLVVESCLVVWQHLLFSRKVTPLRWCPSRAVFARQLKLAPHFLAMGTTAAIAGRTHVWALQVFVGQAAVGVYSAASRLLTPLRPYWKSLFRVILPMYHEAALGAKAQVSRLLSTDLRLVAIVGLPPVLLAILFADPLIVLIYGEAGLPVAAPFAILCVHPLLTAVTSRPNTLLLAYHRVGALSTTLILGSVCLAAGNVALSAWLGVTGPAWSGIGRLLVIWVVGHMLLRSTFRIPWVRLLWPAAVSGGVMWAAVLASAYYVSIWGQLGVGLGAYAACLLVSGYLDKDMTRAFSKLLKQTVGKAPGTPPVDTVAPDVSALQEEHASEP